MVSFFKKKNRNSVSIGDAGKSSSSPALLNDYIVYSTVDPPVNGNGEYQQSSAPGSPVTGKSQLHQDKPHSHSGSSGNSFNASTEMPTSPHYHPNPHHQILNHSHNHNNANSSGGNSFTKKSINSGTSSHSSSSSKLKNTNGNHSNNNNIHDRNSIGSTGSKDNIQYNNNNNNHNNISSSSQHNTPVSSYSEKDVFPNGVKRELKGIMLMGEGNEDVLKRARTYINHTGEIHFTQEDLAQYMLPQDYAEEFYQPIQLSLPNIKPLSKHGFDSDTDESDDEGGANSTNPILDDSESDMNNQSRDDSSDYMDSDDLHRRRSGKRSNWANGLSSWTPKSPVVNSQNYSRESPLVALRSLIYDEYDQTLDGDDKISSFENDFSISKQLVDNLFNNVYNNQYSNNNNNNNNNNQYNNNSTYQNSSDQESSLGYNYQDVDVDITNADIRASNNSSFKSTDSEVEDRSTSHDNTRSTRSNSSSLKQQQQPVTPLSNNIVNTLINKNNYSSGSLRSRGSSNGSSYKVSSKLPNQVSTISKSILKDLDSSDNDILQSLDMVIDSPQSISSSKLNKSPLSVQQHIHSPQESPSKNNNSNNETPTTPLILNRNTGKIDILGEHLSKEFDNILSKSFKNARKSILFEKKILFDSSDSIGQATQDSKNEIIEQLQESNTLGSSFSGLEKLKNDIQNFEISSTSANVNSDVGTEVSTNLYSSMNTQDMVDHSDTENSEDLSDITRDDSTEKSTSSHLSDDNNIPVFTTNVASVNQNHTNDDQTSNTSDEDELEFEQDEQQVLDKILESGNSMTLLPHISINDDNCVYFKDNENPYDIYSPPSSNGDIDLDSYQTLSHQYSQNSLRSIQEHTLLEIQPSDSNEQSHLTLQNQISTNTNSNNNNYTRSNSKSSFNSNLSELSELLISLERKPSRASILPVQQPQQLSPKENTYNNDSEEEVEYRVISRKK
ncbi:hypothetical protein DLAC_07600 [Tieghemostelium lacteum]|uniref:Uncharacterized protein n=1 Tax=Tieghemostelium lacteum TaxID=361077 RepID=A0A151ZD49_TIELA|nr:hypothetical protein DLAC_07600 [Tieghemostelium lacteum]|eukprot:KYQ91804.1 hypothetical protein DLAC_07600 [Tieghemostelium lacteum]